MATFQRNFISGKMNKSVDERLVPNGQYIDAVNIRLGSSESTEVGSVENSKGNTRLTVLSYKGNTLSDQARCIGALEDGANETIYWLVHDPTFKSSGLGNSPTGKIDLIVSFNTITNLLTYHVISVSDGGLENTVLNFDNKHLITGINIIDGLLFWTDDYNPPRFINTLRNYEDPSGVPLVDGNGNAGLLQESLLVIKKPPYSAPLIELTTTSGGDENYLEERFISFAYRYEYQDDEYSATSQFSDAAFNTKTFNFSPESYLNEGVINSFNTAIITYNSGGPLVTAIDLLFKDSDGTIIKVIEKLKKADLGLADNTDYTFNFRNSKIFTILPTSELLRLYDNVPLLAKAQTLMGNRLMYGNYIENYNLVDKNNSPVRFEFSTELISENIGFTSLEDSFDSVAYTFGANIVIDNAQLIIDFDEIDLVAGSEISIEASFIHSQFSGNTPTETTQQVDISFQYILQQDFNSVYDLAIDVDFQEKIGVLGNIKPVYSSNPLDETSCQGNTLTDIINCEIPNILDANEPTSWTKFASGISSSFQPIGIVASPGSNVIGLELIAMQRVDNPASPLQFAYEYFDWNFAEVNFQIISNTKSLHSNRDYEIGMIYMDEYNRSSTALVSPLNSEHIPCGFSEFKNFIKVKIPPQQNPPYWATKYKFAIKPSAEGYETIYVNIFFTDPSTNETYFLLDGENQRKVETGDRYIVKLDTSGVLQRCSYATVLEKEAKEADFIVPPPQSSDNEDIPVPAGTYMKIKAQDFAIDLGDNPFVLPGKQSATATTEPNTTGSKPILYYKGFGENDGTGNFDNYTIPAGSIIKLTFRFTRKGPGQGNNKCERRKYKLDASLISSKDYDDIIDWWNGDNIQRILNTGEQEVGGSGCDIDNVYIPNVSNTIPSPDLNPSFCTNKYQWYKNQFSNEIKFIISGTEACGKTTKRKSKVSATFEIFRAESTIVFETFPTDAQPDVWYEGSQTFDIVKDGCNFVLDVGSNEPNPIAFIYALDNVQQQIIVQPGTQQDLLADCGSVFISPVTPPVNPLDVLIESKPAYNGHKGNVQDQSAINPAIIDTSFFNCFAFGNGVESYKIRDSIVGRPLLLGNRVTTVSAEDYRQANRFADITYSGIYNDESNVNKLNEFNLGLINFKKTEESFGPIQKLFARSTDVLTLQEDKISYVLAGKNLLSDSAAGGSITSVPEVLGTQIARLEEFGISFNPESFAVYGYNKYFSDQKRGVLLQLKGSAYSNEQLTVISEAGMRSWFRDKFIASPNTQKLGGYDPYMDEYVFSINDELLPINIPCIECGVNQLINYSGTLLSYCFNVGDLVGDVTITLNISDKTTGTLQASAIYGQSLTEIDLVNGLNTIVIDKNDVLNETLNLSIDGSSAAIIDYTVSCPDANIIQIIQVCISEGVDAGKFIHNQYRWVDGSFVSPLHQEQIQLTLSSSNPIVSQYSSVSGAQGAGVIPADGAVVSIISNQIPPTDDFVFVTPPMNFKYLRSATLYPNTPASIQTLISLSNTLAVNSLNAPTTYLSDFIMPTGNSGEYLYLIYDYREPGFAELCYSTTSNVDACCGCNEPVNFIATQCRADGVVETEVITGAYTLDQLVTIQGCTYIVGVTTNDQVTASVSAILPAGTICEDICQTYILGEVDGVDASVSYINCNGESVSVIVPANSEVQICARDINLQVQGVEYSLEDCECNPFLPFLNIETCAIDWITTGNNTEIIVNSGLFNVGDLINISEDPNCTYVVTSETYTGPATATATSLSSEISCNNICNNYNVINDSSANRFTYTDCNGTIINESIPIGSFIGICATQAAFQNGYSLQLKDCNCLPPPSFDSGVIINGLLNDASDITLQSEWTIANNIATYDGTSTGSVTFNLSPTLIVGETYTLRADISNASTYAFLLIESRNSTTGSRTQFLPYTVINNGTSVEIVSFTFTGTDVDQLRVTARASSGGSSFDSAKWSLIQGPSEPDTDPPTIPTNLTTTSISDTSISLAWSASTDNVGVSQYNMYVDGVLNKNTTALNTTVTGLTALTAYDFTVSAVDAAGNESAQSSVTQATTTDVPVNPPGQVLAFPTAEGYGKNSVGGRGGTVYIVTSLADSGAGTLREACEASGPRIVTFAVGGRIDVLTPIVIDNPFITIAGQSAPGGGIMITGQVGQPDRLFFIQTSDVIIRYLTFRRSESSTGFNAGDCILIWEGSDIILDHCSASWSSDGNLDIVNQNYDLNNRDLDNISVQYSLFTNSYGGNNKSNLLKYAPSRISWFRNAHVNSKERNPAIASNDVARAFTYNGWYEIANCIFYDYSSATSFSNINTSNSFYLNYLNNIAFQETGGSYSRRMLRFTNDNSNAIAYVDGNIDGEGRPSLASGDEWDVAQLFNGSANKTNPPQSYQKSATAYSTPLINDSVSLWTANNLVSELMPTVGNSIQGRDTEDTRAYDDVINLTATSNNTTNTFPTIANGTPPTDSNGDGISDAWASANMPVGATANDTAPSGYTYIEEYLNEIVDGN